MSGHRASKNFWFRFYDHLKLAKKRKNDSREAPVRIYIGNKQEKNKKSKILIILYVFQGKLVNQWYTNALKFVWGFKFNF